MTQTLTRPARAEQITGRQHGAHLPCQQGAPFVVLICGIAAGWNEQADDSDAARCEPCWESRRCPVCGCTLKPEGES